MNAKDKALAALREAEADRVKLVAAHGAVRKTGTELARLFEEQTALIGSVAKPAQMLAALESFNLQYLQLQMQMQKQNQVFTSVSNVLKTRHDTAKNSISNIR